jgi:hypothetical protein
MMTEPVPGAYDGARVDCAPDLCRGSFDRVPFGFDHNLGGLDLFGQDALAALARRYDRDYFVAAGAQTPGTRFYSVDYGADTPYAALQTLDTKAQRILLKRPENYDARYRELMRVLFAQVLEMRGGLAKDECVVRLDSSILISSAATITPFHFDPEVSFFFQVEGPKTYHLYDPSALSEPELEAFYWMGIVNIGQVELAGRDPRKEYIFALDAGKGLHQPQNSPHWVETGATRSVSYVFSFETNLSRALGRTRAFNHYVRKVGLQPSPPRVRPVVDAAGATIMQAVIPLRKRIARAVRSTEA